MRRILRQLVVSSKWFVVFYFLLTTLYPLVYADTIYFTAGDSIKGLVVEEHRDRIVLSTEQGERTLLRREIDEIFYAEPERNYLYLGDQALEQGEWALARGFFQKARQTNPAFREAEDALQRLGDAERKLHEPPVPNPVEVLWSRWGLSLETVGGSAVVAHVRENSFPAEASLEPGDGIIGYWDESTRFLPASEVAEFLLGPAGTEIQLTVRRAVTLPAVFPGQRNWPGWKLEMERLGLTVLETMPEGAAGLAGLKPGDRIVELNGQPTRYLPLGQARRTVQKSRDKGLVLVIDRDLRIRRE